MQSTATAHIRIRPLRTGETGPVDAVFEGMSAHSRYLRFHGPRPRLTASMRRQLAAVDGHRHIAVLAEVVDGDRVTTVGVARFIATGEGVGEVAFAVVDAWQGCGVGGRLLRALRYRAIDLGHEVIVAHVMAENRPAIALLRSVFPDVVVRRNGVAYDLVATLSQPVDATLSPAA